MNKVCNPTTDTGKFNLQIDGVTKAADALCGGTTGPVIVSAGTHTVAETAGAGTGLADYATPGLGGALRIPTAASPRRRREPHLAMITNTTQISRLLRHQSLQRRKHRNSDDHPHLRLAGDRSAD